MFKVIVSGVALPDKPLPPPAIENIVGVSFNITDFEQLDIPVDIQVARFTIYTGVLSLDEETFRGCVHEEPLRSLIEEAWRNAAGSLNTYPWKLDEPIWTIGSKLCSKKKCSKCPVKQLCEKNFHVSFKNAIALWS